MERRIDIARIDHQILLIMSRAKKQPLPSLFPDPPAAEPTKTAEKSNDEAFDLLDALQAPILTHNVSWADTIPERLRKIIPIARQVALKNDEDLATYAECCVFIYTRTLEAPMTSDWTNIYTYVSCKTLQDWFNEDRWEAVHAPRELSEWLQHQLDGLRRHIYRKRREILKRRLKTDQPAASPAEKEKPSVSLSAVQQSLFEF